MVTYAIIAALVTGAIAALYIILPWCARNLLRRVFLAGVEGGSYACLTFDDGPNNEFTPRLLRLLKEEEIKATFFLTGENTEKYPEMCNEIIKHGHEIGEHGYSHVHPWLASPLGSISDLIRGSSVIKKHCALSRNLLLRPPYGKLNLITLCYVLLCRRRLAFWNIDPKDYCSQAPEEIAQSVQKRLGGSAVILLHDRVCPSENAAESKIKAIKLIVERIRECGYEFATVSDAITACGRKRA